MTTNDKDGARVVREVENSDGKDRHQFEANRYNGAQEEKHDA